MTMKGKFHVEKKRWEHIKTSEFENRKANLYNYFKNRDKWKEDEYGELFYYKGKRNLRELKFILQLVFGDAMEIISEDYFKDNNGDIVGGSISCLLFVDADFNGRYQGTQGADVYIKFTLTEQAYFSYQSSSVEGLK